MKTIPGNMLCCGVIIAMMIDADSCLADDSPSYTPVPDFLTLPDDVTLGKCSAVAINSDGHIYLFHRGKKPIICVDKSGKFVRAWGNDLIGVAHGMRIDRDDNVWVTDIGHHVVYKFSPTGKLLLALGKVDRPGADREQFNKPTDVAFGPDGVVFVSDGYENTRVVKFEADGRYVTSWGTPGDQPGEFNLPHSIIVDKNHRVLVGDRENDRVQIFDLNGKRLGIWNGFAPYGMAIDGKHRVFVADGRANQVLRLKPNGQVDLRIGSKGQALGQFNLPHMLAFDNNGNLYVAEVGGERLQKFQPVNPDR
jgi:DNA-binding beta-propeller fold protein YncE